MTIVILTYDILKDNLGIDYKLGNYLKELIVISDQHFFYIDFV